MPFPPHAPSIYFDTDEINQFVEILSERFRASRLLKPCFDKLVGNQWYEFETEVKDFIFASLFLKDTPNLNMQLLIDISNIFTSNDIEALTEIFLDVCLSVFPLFSAAEMNELAERLSALILPIITAKDEGFKQRALLDVHQKITSGSLFSGL